MARLRKLAGRHSLMVLVEVRVGDGGVCDLLRLNAEVGPASDDEARKEPDRGER